LYIPPPWYGAVLPTKLQLVSLGEEAKTLDNPPPALEEEEEAAFSLKMQLVSVGEEE
jgi:hypothetical protein